MPFLIDENVPKTFPTPNYLTLDSFKKGVISLIDQSRLPRDALKEATNLFLAEDGMPTVRPGVGWYGSVSPNGEAIQGVDYFDFEGVSHLVMVAGGNVYRSTDDAVTWDLCSGATLDTSAKVQMNQYNAYLYLTNGINVITRYDGTTTLQTYSSLGTPAAPTVAQTGLGTTNIQYLYKVSAVNEVGFSASSPVGTGVTKFTTTRNGWSATAYATLTLGAVAGATRYDIYISEDAVNYYYVGSSVPATVGGAATFVDDGTGIVVSSTLAPTTSTAEGPLVEELSNVGSRMYGVRDTSNRYRIWFSSANNPKGAFSTAYDGGYLDWAEGGKLIPNKVVDYRDGKNTPIATVFCDSADGTGGIIQMSLDTVTVDSVSVTVPSAYLLPGSRGTPAPGSVVNVLNDYMFYNSQAFYNLGSRAQFLNLLSTDEASANIRPTVKQITTEDEPDICSVYSDAKVYFSVPNSDYTIIYDTERKAWLPRAFTIGFNKFLRYTDTDGIRRLLAYKTGDTKLSEIGSSIQGDYGEAFNTSLVTGLYSTNKNRFEFQWTEEGEVEFSNPQGTVYVELLGIERSRGYLSTNSETIDVQTTGLGWDTFDWDTMNWDDTSVVPDTYSSSTEKRYFNIQKDLNAIQWRITTSSLSARYVLRTLQVWGTPTQGGKPRAWKL